MTNPLTRQNSNRSNGSNSSSHKKKQHQKKRNNNNNNNNNNKNSRTSYCLKPQLEDKSYNETLSHVYQTAVLASNKNNPTTNHKGNNNNKKASLLFPRLRFLCNSSSQVEDAVLENVYTSKSCPSLACAEQPVASTTTFSSRFGSIQHFQDDSATASVFFQPSQALSKPRHAALRSYESTSSSSSSSSPLRGTIKHKLRNVFFMGDTR